MSDLLEDLRWVSENMNEGSEGRAAVESAIAEIERLRAENETLHHEISCYQLLTIANVAKLRGQLAECRRLLREARDNAEHSTDDEFSVIVTATWLHEAAKAAGGGE